MSQISPHVGIIYTYKETLECFKIFIKLMSTILCMHEIEILEEKVIVSILENCMHKFNQDIH